MDLECNTKQFIKTFPYNKEISLSNSTTVVNYITKILKCFFRSFAVHLLQHYRQPTKLQMF